MPKANGYVPFAFGVSDTSLGVARQRFCRVCPVN